MTSEDISLPGASAEHGGMPRFDQAGQSDMTAWLTGLVQSELWNEMRRWIGSSRPTALGGKESTSDIMQSAFRLAYINRHQCQGESAEERASWFRTIVKRKLLTLQRRYTANSRSLAREQTEADAGAETPSLSERAIDAEDSPVVRAIARELEANIAAVFREISAPQLEVIYLRFYEQLSRAEIAERLGISAGQVASRMRAALTKLRGLLDDPLRDDRSS